MHANSRLTVPDKTSSLVVQKCAEAYLIFPRPPNKQVHDAPRRSEPGEEATEHWPCCAIQW
jgi:hypothetical protein